jgi:prepilin-type N-terminal cleavage/methylation domain-containing protein
VPRRTEKFGFSLIELLTVMALIGFLSALIAPVVSSIGKASSLVTTGNKLAVLVDQARQNSMARNVMTALVITDQGTTGDYRAATLLEYNAEDTAPQWKQITKWENFPVGVLVDTLAEGSSFLSTAGGALPFVPPVLKYRGNPVTNYASRVFLPNGGLSTPTGPAQIKLVEGIVQDGSVTYTRPASAGKAANFYTIAIVGATGRTKIARP